MAILNISKNNISFKESGTVKDVNNSTLRLGKSESCGHDMTRNLRENRYKESDKNIIGKRFGRLVALKRINDMGKSKYLCQCDCGNKVKTGTAQLLDGVTSSCGCLKKDISKKSMKKIMEIGHKKIKEGSVEGTSIYSLDQKSLKTTLQGSRV